MSTAASTIPRRRPRKVVHARSRRTTLATSRRSCPLEVKILHRDLVRDRHLALLGHRDREARDAVGKRVHDEIAPDPDEFVAQQRQRDGVVDRDAAVAYTGPLSSPSSTFMRQTPVSWSPARIARSSGAAPRQRGNKEKCRFTIGSCSSKRAGMMLPKATTTASSTRALRGRPCHGSPRSRARSQRP